ncbi:MAG: ISL3 family transposase [Flavobacteriaceae bacterium]|nr:ISL3 family transposase [Flavobacteriaceae bacterium]
MQVKTVLNKCHRFKRFVYHSIKFMPIKGKESIVAEIVPRSNSQTICSGCKRCAPGYDHCGKARLFQFVPLWGFQVYFLYLMRRVDCERCGIKVEEVPWAQGKSSLTSTYQIFLAQWGRRLSWQEVADVFETSWNKVFSSVKMVVEYGLKHRNLEGIRAIGVDEWQWRKGHNYVTLVYQIEENCKRLLFISERRTVKSLLKFFRMIGNEASGQIQYICSDMWKPYLKVIKKKAPQALHILDRFHIISNLNKAINEIRAGEARKMKQEGYEEVLTHTKYCFLKNPENLTDNQKTKLGDVLQYDLKSVRAYLLKEAFQLFWSYKSPYWAGWYLEKWCNRAMRSKLEPIKKFAKSMRKHRPLIMNYFKAKKQFSSGVVEGLNRKINLTTRKAFGFRTFEGLQIALFHTMGNLPEPKTTHRFF